MTERVAKQLAFLRDASFRKMRDESEINLLEATKDMSDRELAVHRFVVAADAEMPVFLGDDLFGFSRYRRRLPVTRSLGNCNGNVTIDYETVLAGGLQGIEDEIHARYDNADEEGKRFYDGVLIEFAACKRLVERYRIEAERTNRTRLAKALAQVPIHGARDYYEALVTTHFLHYITHLDYCLLMTIGHFDDYMRPYFDISVANGATYEELLELTELYFITINLDGDIYSNLQLGDNGKSMVLGGINAKGNDVWCALSDICIEASEELCLIDPKINVRVNKNTPLSFYERMTKLTKLGLGFPQYLNDDVVIPGLLSLGYEKEDAQNYTCAACWEYIIPRCGNDIPNIGAANFALVAERTVKKHLLSSDSFDDLLHHYKEEFAIHCDEIVEIASHHRLSPSPLLSAFILPCIEKGRDQVDDAAKYNNIGFHGVAISTAADSLMAVKKAIYEEKVTTKEALLAALKANYEGAEELRRTLLSYPKMGNNHEEVDAIACELLALFDKTMNNRKNARGGICRAGTGSAQAYIFEASHVGATPDGRYANTPFACSFSPSLTARVDGPLSSILSFTKFDLKRVINGGPFTMEIHDTVFRNEESERKVAMLVKAFIDRGGHQMQLNAVNRQKLLDAQKAPENYPNLVVRVWGWSGYFIELDKEFQDHIIARTEFTL